jgi:hypothetical protein
MTLNFPATPVVGDTYAAEGRAFTWNGSVWVLSVIASPFATEAEAIAGTRADRAMSPALTKLKTDEARIATGTSNPLSETPTDMLSQRARLVPYQNTFNRPMCLSAWGTTSVELLIGSTPDTLFRFLRHINPALGAPRALFGIVPPRWWYMLDTNGSVEFSGWIEYR